MRSRYSAFAKGLVPYLLDTWDPVTRPDGVTLDPDQRWIALRIIATVAGTASDDVGTVEFVATSDTSGRRDHMHEVSDFVRLDGRWVYTGGRVDHAPHG